VGLGKRILSNVQHLFGAQRASKESRLRVHDDSSGLPTAGLPTALFLEMSLGRLRYLTPTIPSLKSVVMWIDGALATSVGTEEQEDVLRKRVIALNDVLVRTEVALQAPTTPHAIREQLAQAVHDALTIHNKGDRELLTAKVTSILSLPGRC